MATYQIYCDETCTGKEHTYSGWGAVMLEFNEARQFAGDIVTWRGQTKMVRELKWTKVTRDRLPQYTAFASLALDKVRSGSLSFRSMVLDRSRLDYKKYQAGDEELGFHKFIYQLLFHCFCKRLEPTDKVVVFLDARKTTYNYDGLKDALNRNLRRRCGFKADAVSNVQPVDSKSSQLMQVNDVLLGAVGFHANSREQLPASRKAKIALAAHICSEVGLADLRQNRTLHNECFGVWQFRLQ